MTDILCTTTTDNNKKPLETSCSEVSTDDSSITIKGDKKDQDEDKIVVVVQTNEKNNKKKIELSNLYADGTLWKNNDWCLEVHINRLDDVKTYTDSRTCLPGKFVSCQVRDQSGVKILKGWNDDVQSLLNNLKRNRLYRLSNLKIVVPSSNKNKNKDDENEKKKDFELVVTSSTHYEELPNPQTVVEIVEKCRLYDIVTLTAVVVLVTPLTSKEDSKVFRQIYLMDSSSLDPLKFTIWDSVARDFTEDRIGTILEIKEARVGEYRQRRELQGAILSSLVDHQSLQFQKLQQWQQSPEGKNILLNVYQQWKDNKSILYTLNSSSKKIEKCSLTAFTSMPVGSIVELQQVRLSLKNNNVQTYWGCCQPGCNLRKLILKEDRQFCTSCNINVATEQDCKLVYKADFMVMDSFDGHQVEAIAFQDTVESWLGKSASQFKHEFPSEVDQISFVEPLLQPLYNCKILSKAGFKRKAATLEDETMETPKQFVIQKIFIL
jgi:hypothetical protein